MSKFSKVTAGKPHFTALPPIGHCHVYRDQVFTAIGHIDRGATKLVEWQSYCAECGEPYSLTSSKQSHSLTRRCATHAAGKFGQRIKADKVHPASQGFIAASKRAKSETTPAPAGVAAHPLYAEWCALVDATPELKRRNIPKFHDWVKQHEDYSQLD